MGKSINEWTNEVHENAKTKGWWETPRSPLEIAALIHSEVSEFVEEARKPDARASYMIGDARVTILKPEGMAIELADVVIRVMDYFGHMGWDLENVIRLKHEYNKTRSIRHGGKRF